MKWPGQEIEVGLFVKTVPHLSFDATGLVTEIENSIPGWRICTVQSKSKTWKITEQNLERVRKVIDIESYRPFKNCCKLNRGI